MHLIPTMPSWECAFVMILVQANDRQLHRLRICLLRILVDNIMSEWWEKRTGIPKYKMLKQSCKFSGTERFTKNKFRFSLISLAASKKKYRARVPTILMPPTFPIARLNRYTPNFSGVPQKLTWCQQFGLQIFPKWGDADICRLEMAVFRCFFGRNKFSRPNGRLSPIACHTYLESYGT